MTETEEKLVKGPWPPKEAPPLPLQVTILDNILKLQANLRRQIVLLDKLRAMLLVGWRHAGNIHDYRKDYFELLRCHAMDRWKVPQRLHRYEKTLRRRAEQEKVASG